MYATMNSDGDAETTIADRMRDHVFGDNGPTQSLINEECLPDGWAIEYLNLLRIAADQWQYQPMYRRELVAAVQFASWYLNRRCDAWCENHDRNEATERELASLRSPSELFLMHGSLDMDSEAT